VSAAISPATGRSYGVQRVCRVWVLPRSSFYHAANRNTARRPARRGPAPPVAEVSLLAAIKADLASSPFRGEGHRKVWARLRYGLGLPVGRNRVLRLMRENQLLSPYRRPPRPANDHDGTILTEAPDVPWGTDASMVQTLECGGSGRDGVRVEHAAIDAADGAVRDHRRHGARSRRRGAGAAERFGGIAANAARGVTVRADNGPQYIARHFTRQIAHWGMALSHAFPHQPETNGVCERFFRTLKEQAIFGRIFRTAVEIRAAVSEFVARYNACWRLARLGFRSPIDYRARHSAASSLLMAA